MNSEQVALVQRTFRAAEGLGEKVAEIFYEELFAIDPSLRSMFSGDMREQHRKLLGALAMVVNGLNQPERVIPAAQKLAIKHLDYGVTARHYTIVGNALLRTLKKGLGDAFTPEVRAAWIAAYQVLADVMRAAAYPSQARSA
ncbi:MAG: hemin receptor [Proteobacteria bacterium]|nr:hemin receptor [Pseudomonadota bacterium]